MLFTSGCGYTTTGLGSSSSKTIYVSNFINKINPTEETSDSKMHIAYKSGMEFDVTRDLINRFIVDGNMRIANQTDADLVLSGELVDFRKEPLRYDTADNVIEYRIKVTAIITLIDNKTNNILKDAQRFTGESIYRTTGEYAKSEDLAVKDAVKDLGTRLIENIIEDW